MTRQFHVVGETMVMVRFGGHISNSVFAAGGTFPVSGTATVGYVFQLGLAEGEITITPEPNHANVLVADYGPNVPADILFNNVECIVRMKLAHFDAAILDVCTSESWGGGMTVATVFDNRNVGVPTLVPLNWGENIPGAGTLLGNGIPPGLSGCHFVGLILNPANAGTPYEFPGAFLSKPPYSFPIGTKRSTPDCTWRCIPYSPAASGVKTTFSGGRVLGGGGGASSFSITCPVEIESSGVPLLTRKTSL